MSLNDRISFRVVFALFAGSVFAFAASGQEKFIANASSLQAIPSSGSQASALCRVTLNASANSLSMECDYAGLDFGPTFSIHEGAGPGEIAPATTTLPLPSQSGSFALNLFLPTPPQGVPEIRKNRWYVNFSSTAFPQGEIRGQLKLANGTYNDYDGDGRTDLQVYRNSVNTFYALRSTNGTPTGAQLGSPGDSVSLTVDFDGDGLSDFSTARYNAEVLWRILPSATNVLRETRWGSSTLGDFFAAADYDGDGKFDIAVFRAGVWYIIESSTGNVRYEYFGQSGDVPAPNDFDRDGKADLAIARGENGQRVWYRRLSTNGTITAIPFGLTTDAFFTGRTDFDADGAADLLVIRNQSGQRVFYILRSSDSQLQVIPWGLSSDVVKLGDYDGDARTDLAVTRAVNGQRVFYILQSTNGQTRIDQFGLAGDF
jgi:hypothetical protein